MTLKLLGMAPSTSTGRVLATLYEKDVTDFELEKVNLNTGEHKKPEFVALQVCDLPPSPTASVAGRASFSCCSRSLVNRRLCCSFV